ncbi:HER021Wp [Eremothecium sinecaudum]|uniref:HER021Wp n=1 Tax=Eremothecium sinecaudum TaxID=45286 RepID=A0A109UZE3_9SACH|nr:HER021Wp [Eremothecium sinecaudum]AMD21300.1 HER021Wp [Eremothecium sinecaudum]
MAISTFHNNCSSSINQQGFHQAKSISEQSPLLNKQTSFSYFKHQDAPIERKISSKYDPDNPNRNKLGTFDGVFVPITINVLSILVFLRFGYILGQMGILGTLFLLLISYVIDLLTTLSISAISTNGTVRGGGAYYMISRCLGPEFGGSIGIIFFLGQILNSGMNAVGLVEPLLYSFGLADESSVPSVFGLLPRGRWFQFIYSTIILLLCLGIALVGSSSISRAGTVLFWLLLLSILSIPFSAFVVPAFKNGDIVYTGLSWETFRGNIYPKLTKGAAGSVSQDKETFNNIFGVFFPAAAGIFAGAGMSSELRKPSKSIPKGTLWGLLLTFTCYTLVIISLGATVPRDSLHKDVQIVQTISMSQIVIFLGEVSASLFSIIVGIVGAAYVLEAIAIDRIIPGLSRFEKRPVYSLVFSWLLTQCCLFFDVNQIATFITMTFLMTFIIMNMACFLLEISSAPNFRPAFKWFDRYTALAGGVLCIIAMFIVDGVSASIVFFMLLVLFLLIHYSCPPKPWGYVSQSLIYHQVRKYLLRLKQDNIKYWRPQVLLLVDNPRTSWNLIRFCNHLKKGGLYILGHVTVSNNFQAQFNELKKQTAAWVKIRDMANIKAFVHIGTGPTLPWGVRNVYLGSGLGGMKPNITVLGFFDLGNHYESKKGARQNPSANEFLRASPQPFRPQYVPKFEVGVLPTDDCKDEVKIKIQQWVQIIEDLSLMQSTIAVAHGFKDLVLPNKHSSSEVNFIDLYPIQMSAKMVKESSCEAIITTNFDTYTLILQLGAILVTVPDWKRTHKLRVIVFVENRSERANEKARIANLLSILRIEAETVVLSLDEFKVYNDVVNGSEYRFDYVNSILKDSEWWQDLVEARKTHRLRRKFTIDNEQAVPGSAITLHDCNISRLQRLGVSLTMNTNIPLPMDPAVFMFYDTDEEDSVDMFGPSASAISLDHELSIKSPADRALKPHKLKSKFRDDRSIRSLLPVFTSDALPKTKVIDDSTGQEPSLIPLVDKDDHKSKDLRSDISSNYGSDNVMDELNELRFNSIPSRAQHLILNDMMSQVSRNSKLIFSTLPIPPLGTHKDKDDSLQYVEDLDLWLYGLPPTMLINSQSMTVTTAL